MLVTPWTLVSTTALLDIVSYTSFLILMKIPFNHPSDCELYSQTGQVSVKQMALEATATLAWKCGKDWKNNPLAKRRIQEHSSGRQTRQRTQRTFPPQFTRGSLLSRMVEVWERLPNEVKTAEDWEFAKRNIKTWTEEFISGWLLAILVLHLKYQTFEFK